MQEFTPKTGRKATQTNLTPGELGLLAKLRKLLHCQGDADTLRMLLRDRAKAEGLLA